MDKNKNLKDQMADYQVQNTNPDLEWDAIGGRINAGVAQRQKQEKKRRILLWIMMGMVLSGVVFIAASYDYTRNNNHSTSQTSSVNGALEEGKNRTEPSTQSNREVLPADLATEKLKGNRLNSTSKIDHEITLNNNSKNIEFPVSDSSNSVHNHNSVTDQNDTTKFNKVTQSEEDQLPLNTSQLLNFRNIIKQEPDTDKLKMSKINLLAGYQYRLTEKKTTYNLPKLTEYSPTFTQKSQNTWFSTQLSSHFTNFENQYENVIDGIGVGAEVLAGKTIWDNLYIGSGIAYDQYMFRTEFEERTNVQVYQPMTTDTIFMLSGEVIGNTTTDSIPGVSTRSFRHHNSYTTLSIPVQLSYNYNVGRCQVITTVGTSIAILRRGDGVLGNNTILSTVQDPEGSRWSYYGQLGLGYQLTKRNNINLNIRYQNRKLGESRQGIISSGIQIVNRF